MIAGSICLVVSMVLLFPANVLSSSEIPSVTPAIDRLAEPTVPANPSQADEGAVAYWFSCMVCHGDRGQGLTEEWRAVSGPEDMNCWQSRCHASNHPPEGFVLPPYAPKIIGQGALAHFNTAADLYTFVAENMPWQAPGVLDEQTYWQLTAFLLRENGVSSGAAELSPQNADQVYLRSEDTGAYLGMKIEETTAPVVVGAASQDAQKQPVMNGLKANPTAIALMAIMLLVTIIWFLFRLRR